MDLTYVILEHLLGLLEGEVQDDEGVDVEGDGVRPQNVDEPEELDPEALVGAHALEVDDDWMIEWVSWGWGSMPRDAGDIESDQSH